MDVSFAALVLTSLGAIASSPAAAADTRSLESWAVVFATLMGPVLAVQAQKWVESRRAARDRKERVFEVLMATRNAFMSVEHVQALNMIEVTFYGRGPGKRKATEDAVLDQWRYYLSFLTEVGVATQPLAQGESYQNPQPHQFQRRDELFVDLLASIASDLGYHYDKATLKPTGGYSPWSHAHAAESRARLIDSANDLLSGRRSVAVRVVDQ